MSNIDIDNNGYIDYTEFVLATINKKKLLTRERLELAFAMFDKVFELLLMNYRTEVVQSLLM